MLESLPLIRKAELQSELNALREQVHSSGGGANGSSPSNQGMSLSPDVGLVKRIASQPDHQRESQIIQTGEQRFGTSETGSNISPVTEAVEPAHVWLEATNSQILQDLHVSAEEINDCFQM